MRALIGIVIAWFFVPMSVFAATSDMVIVEVMFNPAGVDTGFEYIALENKGSELVDLTGWDFYPDDVGYFTFPAFTLAGHKRVTVYLRAAGTNDAERFYHTAVAGREIKDNMGNTSGSVAIFASTDHKDENLIDFVEYGKAGETWESSADKMGLWKKGEYVSLADFQEGQILSRKDAGHGVSSWEVKSALPASTPTPPPATPTPEIRSQGKVYSGPEIKPKIRAYAGRDKTSVAGSEVVFGGKALGWQDDILSGDQIRYMWNFGDGILRDGKKITHIYEYPGTYTATLYVVSGEESEADSIKVTIADNPVRINEIMPGKNGWIELVNPADVDVDIGAWRIKSDSSAFFSLPSRSVLAARSFIVLTATTTGLSFEFSYPKAAIVYPNGKIADELTFDGNITENNTLARVGQDAVVKKPTPGSANDTAKTAVYVTNTSSTTRAVADQSNSKTADSKALSQPLSSEQPVEVQPKEKNSALPAQVSGGETRWLIISIVVGALAGGAFLAMRLLL